MNRTTAVFLAFALVAAAGIACVCIPGPPSPQASPEGPTDAPTEAPTATSTSKAPTPVVTPTSGAEPTADIIFLNGTVLTMAPRAAGDGYQVAEAIAIQGDGILAVGSDDEILILAGSETQVIDLAGQTVLPGLADGHTHILAFSDRMVTTLEETQDVALSFGFTSVTEMWADEPFLEVLMRAEEEGRLRLRVNVFPIYNDGILDENGDKVLVRAWHPANAPVLDSDRMLRIPGIKVFVDGASTPGRGCPALSEPYEATVMVEDWFTELCGSERGDLYWSQDEINEVVADAQAAGYRVAFHAMGDAAIETVLDAIAFALDGEPNELHRHQIQHNSMLRPDLLQRYVAQDVLCSVRGYFNTCEQDFYVTAYGPHRHKWTANRYSLPGLGIHTYLETDFAWTVDPADPTSPRTNNPMVHLYGLVTHQQVNQDGEICAPDPWIAQHTISVEQALRMMTFEPAYAVSQEHVLGTLEPGKFADMIILSDNPMTVGPSKLKDLEVWMTMVGGSVEYCAPGHEPQCPLWEAALSPAEKPTDAPAPEPTDSPAPPPVNEPVRVNILRAEERVPANTPVELTVGWLCDTREQVADFIAAAAFTVILDGQTLPDETGYWQAIEEAGDSDQDGDVDYLSRWIHPVGALSLGTHQVETHATLQWTVTDGFDSDGDGLLDEYSGSLWQSSLQVIVEE
jgi:predicted amidohydrolase YtcJ